MREKYNIKGGSRKSFNRVGKLNKNKNLEIMKTINETKMEKLIKTLYCRKVRSGLFYISIELDQKIFKTTTTSMCAIGAAFDEYYDEDYSGIFYSTRYEAQEALVDEILKANDIKL